MGGWKGGQEGGRKGGQATLNSSPTATKVSLWEGWKRFLPVQELRHSLEGTQVLLLPVSKMTWEGGGEGKVRRRLVEPVPRGREGGREGGEREGGREGGREGRTEKRLTEKVWLLEPICMSPKYSTFCVGK
jgi:hypothetical protein